uniref:Uncharacterized protein n=1 Tax=viral metagenome TaxID=1070528 RepID=A0A6C0BTF1_9ZZZZ
MLFMFFIKGNSPAPTQKMTTVRFADEEWAGPNTPRTKTINELVSISGRKSHRMSSGCLKLGSRPHMKVLYPLLPVVLQNRTVSNINKMLTMETDGRRPITYYENYEIPFQLPRQPATEPSSSDEEEQ